jgi:nucleoside-triphosphatase
VTRAVVERLRRAAVATGGFVTNELLGEDDRRIGFEVCVLGGPAATIARADELGAVQVGRYGVDIDAFEDIALRAVRETLDSGGVLVLDELGSMELASDRFVRLLAEVFEAPVSLLATVHLRQHPVTDAIKARSDVELVTVTAENRDALPELVSEPFIAWWRSRRLT